jgi:hypothetical protein
MIDDGTNTGLSSFKAEAIAGAMRAAPCVVKLEGISAGYTLRLSLVWKAAEPARPPIPALILRRS